MFSKILIGVFAVAIMSVGGFAYYHHMHGGCCDSCSEQTTCPSQPQQSESDVPSCCLQPSRIQVSTESCCCSGEESVKPVTEVLAIEPREVK